MKPRPARALRFVLPPSASGFLTGRPRPRSLAAANTEHGEFKAVAVLQEDAMADSAGCEPPAEAHDAAAGLVYASSDMPGLTRRRAGAGFAYRDAEGRRIGDAAILKRIRSLAIPPAWTGVWINPDPNGHIQAVGQDARGRRQYRYHPRFREAREEVKFEHMMAFAEALPRVRRQIAVHMAAPGLGRTKVLATLVQLLESTMIRIGNKTYAKENKSYGLTTLLSRHVRVEGAALHFHFKGKSGKIWRLDVRDRRVARVVRTCQELPGQHLFQYTDEAGERQAVTSGDVNAYLRQISGADITAKDFRTWAGTVMAAVALGELGAAANQAQAKRNVTQAIEGVAARLGNTPAICRECYVHPGIVDAYMNGTLSLQIEDADPRPLGEPAGLRPEEAGVLSFLRRQAARNPSEPARAA
jgi:DNA topoisomerase-1